MDKSDWKQREWRKERGGDKQTMENAVIKKRKKNLKERSEEKRNWLAKFC